MATPIILPQQGNSVESCLIAGWKKQVGDAVKVGEVVCEIETDKALFTIESSADGVLLARFFEAGAEVPVMTNIGVIGAVGEDVAPFRPDSAAPASTPAPVSAPTPPQPPSAPAVAQTGGVLHISPRALRLAIEQGIDYTQLSGTGPEGRIIERDILSAKAAHPPATPTARALASASGHPYPATGSGIGGRIVSADLSAPPQATAPPDPTPTTDDETDILARTPMTGIRKVTAQRMLASLQESAQLTLHSSADARALLAYRAKLKASDDALGLRGVTLNDMLLFAVARVLPDYPALNATLEQDVIAQYRAVHLGFAVDVPRGLVVPVIHNAQHFGLKALANEAKRLAKSAQDGKLYPHEMRGGTFTVTNLGGLGVESFTPILNPPQVAILGVGTTQLKPIETLNGIEHVPHMGLSLTVDHRAVDGAPAARFLAALAQALKHFDLLLAAG